MPSLRTAPLGPGEVISRGGALGVTRAWLGSCSPSLLLGALTCFMRVRVGASLSGTVDRARDPSRRSRVLLTASLRILLSWVQTTRSPACRLLAFAGLRRGLDRCPKSPAVSLNQDSVLGARSYSGSAASISGCPASSVCNLALSPCPLWLSPPYSPVSGHSLFS